MKFVALVVASLLAVQVYGSFDAYQKAARDCVLHLGIHATQLDSYNQFLFPPDPETFSFIRCVLIGLNLYADCSGINWRTIGPNVDEETKQEVCGCISNQLSRIDPGDICAKAYYSLRCFRQNITLILSDDVVSGDASMHPTNTSTAPCSSFVPLTAVQLAEVFTSCLAECGITNFNFCTRENPFPDTPEVRCAAYCNAVRSGVYSEQDGPLLDNLHAQLGRCETLEAFRFRIGLCFQRRQQPPGTCVQKVIYQQYTPCLQPEYERFVASHLDELREPFGYLCVPC